MKKQMKKLLALGLAFTALTQIIQKAQAASFDAASFKERGGAFSPAGGSIEEQVANFESFSSDADFSIITDQLTHALNDNYTAAEQKALCRRLEAILKPEAFAAINPQRMKEFLLRLKATRRLISANLKRLNAKNKEFVELGEVSVADLSAAALERLQETAWTLARLRLDQIAGRLQDLIALDAKALTQTSRNINAGARALFGRDTKEYRESVVAGNFWGVLSYFGESNWYEHEDKEYFAMSFINFVEYVARLSPQNKQKLLEGDDGRQIPESKYLIEGAPFSVPKQLVYAYALLNAGYDAPEFLRATARLVEQSKEDPMSKDLLKLLVATILNNRSNTDLAKEILRSFKSRQDSELFLLRYHVILAGTDQALASLDSPEAQRAYEQEQARLRAAEQSRLAAWRTEEALREAKKQEALRKEALEVQREREIQAQLEATALRETKLEVFRTKSLQRRANEAVTKIQQFFKGKKATENQLNERADEFRAQKLERANKAAKKATFDVLRNEVTEAKARKSAIATIAGVRARVAERKEIERREKAATKIQQSFRAKKENERRKETLRIAQERKKIERKRVLLAEEEAALLKAQKEAESLRVREEAALLKAQEEAALRRVRDVSGADALWGKEKTDIVAERGWADEVGLAGGEAAVRSVEDFVTSIAGPLNKIPGIEKASKPLAMRTLLIGMLASNTSFSKAVRELAALRADYQAAVWPAIKAALKAAGVKIDVLASVKDIADEDKAETVRLLQKGLKTE